jgi:hypothetical protein
LLFAALPISLLHLIIDLAYVLVSAMAPAASRIARAGWVPVAIPQPNSAPEVAPDDAEAAEVPEEARGSSYKPRGSNINLVTKGIALALYYQLPGPNGREKYAQIEASTGVKKRTLNNIKLKAIARGYDPLVDKFRITRAYLEDAPRSGRPNTVINEINEDFVISIISKDKNEKEKSSEVIGNEIGISKQSVCRIMKKLDYKKN